MIAPRNDNSTGIVNQLRFANLIVFLYIAAVAPFISLNIRDKQGRRQKILN